FFGEEDCYCFRAGKTGEYGYDLLVPHAQYDPLHDKLQDIGRAFDMQPVGLAALDQCALENWFFNIRREGQLGLTPLELQRWRPGVADS
ncbi:MAG: hypothetical protein GY946_11515, partial [bacterium]|nr:hypothetical protein [bacterium]